MLFYNSNNSSFNINNRMKIIWNCVNTLRTNVTAFHKMQLHRLLHYNKSKVTSNITVFEPIYSDMCARKSNPIVLIYAWLNANPKHIGKYVNIYKNKGFEIVQIELKTTQFMKPKKVKIIANELIEVLKEKKKQPLLVHVFSVGAYFHTETMTMIEEKNDCESLKTRYKGQILDSMVFMNMDNILEGVSKSFSDNQLIQKILFNIMDSYFKIFYSSVTIHYVKAHSFFNNNPFRIPSLFFCSSNDTIGSEGPVNECVQNYEAREILVRKQCWDYSSHCAHYVKYSNEYMEKLNSFLKDINIDRKLQ